MPKWFLITDQTDNDAGSIDGMCRSTNWNWRNWDSMKQQTLGDRQSTTSGRTNQKLCRVSNKKTDWSHKENQFLWECYERSWYPLCNGYLARMHVLWINAGMKNSPVQRLSVQVKNIKKKSILSRVERHQIYASVTRNNQGIDKEEISI